LIKLTILVDVSVNKDSDDLDDDREAAKNADYKAVDEDEYHYDGRAYDDEYNYGKENRPKILLDNGKNKPDANR